MGYEIRISLCLSIIRLQCPIRCLGNDVIQFGSEASLQESNKIVRRFLMNDMVWLLRYGDTYIQVCSGFDSLQAKGEISLHDLH